MSRSSMICTESVEVSKYVDSWCLSRITEEDLMSGSTINLPYEYS